MQKYDDLLFHTLLFLGAFILAWLIILAFLIQDDFLTNLF